MMDGTPKLIELSEAETSKRAGAILTARPGLQHRRDFATVLLDDIELDTDAEWLIEGVLPDNGLSALWGEPGSGKSFLALDMALAVAQGAVWFDKRTAAGGVAYLAAEGGRGAKKRVLAYRQHFGLRTGLPFALIPAAVDLCTEAGETDALIAELQRLVPMLRTPLRLVVIDTLSRVMAGGNENDSQDMGALIRSADLIREATGAHVLFVHHGGKDKERKTRGHSSLFGALDTAIEVTLSETSGLRTAKVRKQKDGEDGLTFTFKLGVEEIAATGDGAITSCYVVPENEEAPPEQPAARKLSGSLAIALDALRKAVNEHGQIPPACAHIPPQTAAVSPELWRRTFYMMRATDSADANRVAFKRAVIELQNRNLASTWGEYSWVNS